MVPPFHFLYTYKYERLVPILQELKKQPNKLLLSHKHLPTHSLLLSIDKPFFFIIILQTFAKNGTLN